jgi:hypothetical protein
MGRQKPAALQQGSRQGGGCDDPGRADQGRLDRAA